MSIDDVEHQFGIEVTDNQRISAAILEGMGLRFLIDYGLQNCELMAELAISEDPNGN